MYTNRPTGNDDQWLLQAAIQAITTPKRALGIHTQNLIDTFLKELEDAIKEEQHQPQMFKIRHKDQSSQGFLHACLESNIEITLIQQWLNWIFEKKAQGLIDEACLKAFLSPSDKNPKTFLTLALQKTCGPYKDLYLDFIESLLFRPEYASYIEETLYTVDTAKNSILHIIIMNGIDIEYISKILNFLLVQQTSSEKIENLILMKNRKKQTIIELLLDCRPITKIESDSIFVTTLAELIFHTKTFSSLEICRLEALNFIVGRMKTNSFYADLIGQIFSYLDAKFPGDEHISQLYNSLSEKMRFFGVATPQTIHQSISFSKACQSLSFFTVSPQDPEIPIIQDALNKKIAELELLIASLDLPPNYIPGYKNQAYLILAASLIGLPIAYADIKLIIQLIRWIHDATQNNFDGVLGLILGGYCGIPLLGILETAAVVSLVQKISNSKNVSDQNWAETVSLISQITCEFKNSIEAHAPSSDQEAIKNAITEVEEKISALNSFHILQFSFEEATALLNNLSASVTNLTTLIKQQPGAIKWFHKLVVEEAPPLQGDDLDLELGLKIK